MHVETDVHEFSKNLHVAFFAEHKAAPFPPDGTSKPHAYYFWFSLNSGPVM